MSRVILVDTSVWVDHFRRGNPALKELLHDERVLGHSFVVGELACGNLKNREEILGLLATLPQATRAQDSEVLHLIDTERLAGKGLGLIDAHLLASARLSDCSLWTLDKALQKAAARLKRSA